MRSLQIAATGMQAQQTNIEVISNNIANISTTGFKRRRAEFQDLIYQNLRRTGSQSADTGTLLPSGAQLGLGVRTAAIYRISEQGNLQQTENRFDVAIRGNGYFQVLLPSGETSYTRDGTFGLSAEGTIVTAEGFTVQPAITIPPAARDVTINAAGEVLAKIDGQVQPQNVGQLQLANFANEGGLEAIGENLFLATPGSGDAQLGARAGHRHARTLAAHRARACDRLTNEQKVNRRCLERMRRLAIGGAYGEADGDMHLALGDHAIEPRADDLERIGCHHARGGHHRRLRPIAKTPPPAVHLGRIWPCEAHSRARALRGHKVAAVQPQRRAAPHTYRLRRHAEQRARKAVNLEHLGRRRSNLGRIETAKE